MSEIAYFANPPAPRELPTYTCHKHVQAGQILGIAEQIVEFEGEKQAGGRMYTLALAMPDISVYEQLVPIDYITKHQPEVGGYFVRYADGYASYSTAQAFETGYTLGGSKPCGHVTRDALDALPAVHAVGVSIFRDPADNRVPIYKAPPVLAAEVAMLDGALQARGSENTRLKLRIGELEEALRQSGLPCK